MIRHDLAKIYTRRFSKQEIVRKNEIWKVIVSDFLQKFVRDSDTVIDVACGHGDFINNVRLGGGGIKIAIDLNENSRAFLSEQVEFYSGDALSILAKFPETADIVFTSNFLEHLPDKETLNQLFGIVMHALKPGGKWLILGPNLRYLPGEYWDFYDHDLGLTHLSLIEALEINNFAVNYCIDKFLPYTTKCRLPQHPLLVKAYLKIPLAWKFLGKQFFIVAEKKKP
jgi:SAM-dependent methyltransferase